MATKTKTMVVAVVLERSVDEMARLARQTWVLLLTMATLGATAQASVQVFDGLAPEVVRGLQATLRQLHRHGSTGRRVDPAGGLVKSKFRVGACRASRDAYAQAWSCDGVLTTTFGVA